MREPRPKQCKRKEELVLFHITVQIAGKTLPQEIHVCGERHFRRKYTSVGKDTSAGARGSWPQRICCPWERENGGQLAFSCSLLFSVQDPYSVLATNTQGESFIFSSVSVKIPRQNHPEACLLGHFTSRQVNNEEKPWPCLSLCPQSSVVAWIWVEVGEGKKEEECCGGKNELKAKSFLKVLCPWTVFVKRLGSKHPWAVGGLAWPAYSHWCSWVFLAFPSQMFFSLC